MTGLTVLYLAFGKESFFQEVLFSYLNLRAAAPGHDYRVVIYTDNPEWFSGYPDLTLERLDETRLRRWIGVAGCVFRCKIRAMMDCMDKHPGSALLYLDGDTFFNRDPRSVLARLTPETAIMNFSEEGRVNGLLRDIGKRAVLASTDLWRQLGLLAAPASWHMWNAGIIGLHPSQRHLLDQVLYVNDLLFYRSLSRIIEQVAQSVILGGRCRLIPLDAEVVHYFAMEECLLPRLEAFFEENRGKPFGELVSRAAAFRPAMIHDPKLHGMKKLRHSLQKRRIEAGLRWRKRRYRSEWLLEIEESRKLALKSL